MVSLLTGIDTRWENLFLFGVRFVLRVSALSVSVFGDLSCRFKDCRAASIKCSLFIEITCSF